MPRALDKKATKIARARQQRVIEMLQAIFGWDEREAPRVAYAKKRSFPEAERRRRRQRNKAARAARRRNR